MTGFIITFQPATKIQELIKQCECKKDDNLEKILSCNDYEFFEWNVDENATINDIVFFMCDKNSLDNLKKLNEQVEKRDNKKLKNYYQHLLELYEEYSGKVLSIGRIEKGPFEIRNSKKNAKNIKSSWNATFKDMVLINDYVDFFELQKDIKINIFDTVIRLNKNQTKKLLSIAKSKSHEAATWY